MLFTKIFTHPDDPILSFYSTPAADQPILETLLCGPIFWLCFLPDGITQVCTGVMRACGVWKKGALVMFLNNIVISVPASLVFLWQFGGIDVDLGNKGLEQTTQSSTPGAGARSGGRGAPPRGLGVGSSRELFFLWLGLGVGSCTSVVLFLKLVQNIDYRERSLSTLDRLLKEELRGI